MQGSVGDRIVVHGHRLGEPDRDAEILEVHGGDGAPPYLVQWSDSGRVAIYFPGTDASIDPIHSDSRSRAPHQEPAHV